MPYNIKKARTDERFDVILSPAALPGIRAPTARVDVGVESVTLTHLSSKREYENRLIVTSHDDLPARTLFMMASVEAIHQMRLESKHSTLRCTFAVIIRYRAEGKGSTLCIVKQVINMGRIHDLNRRLHHTCYIADPTHLRFRRLTLWG